ncbi:MULTISPECIES: helicase-related protein [Azospirillum]|uniref:Helicase-related protein n=1 Tax=Azospirillum brasilense TaxID=192 RepID=A0ABU4P5C2_AZOBR|nr:MULTISPECIES: helicase-related protein [Azospirillum]ALJ34139.1 disulfide oxidoreductase [Azospirillum brasilense]MDW7552883.1 helicase-related protein [Azospirillum brasilense]MDW7591925.1 helicase-related protein [Azospirillum brasilense]MDW7627798.1 helicase-related protein [Azospirillum brasilense]MDX5952733.1 helicase-related protein [Azospirillum brasilense]
MTSVLSSSGGGLGAGGRVVAVLGPTNTGKTHLAIERMLGHRTGMIGFPLRLLARENYDRIVSIKGKSAVALVTGEEKILPPSPSYWVCTVESMPLDRAVDFLAVDEVQLCADPERGHIFTDRLLNARGLVETMFLGSDTVQPLIRRLVPRAEFISRPRFSQLTYAGYRKLTRLPPRSCVVAFSATDVYALAEMIRRQRGGTAVVLGALSPRTRNAQVGLYQAGEVDYLVATDAIGMGLNMDVDHVAFARIVKFDGFAPRRLRAPEVAQIAGRAGRHMRDGTFGTTDEVGELEADVVDRVENHQFETIKTLMWRNSKLRFDTPGFLLKSLEERPPIPELLRARDADDHLALQALVRDHEVMDLAKGRDNVRLLWEVCQVPDFRKVLSDAHTRLLGQIFRQLRTGIGRLDEDWAAKQIARLDRTEGDIDALVARIAHIRTWTYISNRPSWLTDPVHWQARTRAIEDKLSDALHERLTQRFIDRRSATLVRTLKDGRELIGGVRADGEVVVEGHPVGRLEGFRFVPDAPERSEEAKSLLTAARRALREEVASRLRAFEQEPDDVFALGPDGVLTADGLAVARLGPGPSVLTPAVLPFDEGLLDQGQLDRVRVRLERWLKDRVAARLRPLLALRDAADLTGTARGLAFQVVENMGAMPRAPVAPLVEGLEKADRKALSRHGVRLGVSHLYLTALAKPGAVELRGLLWAVKHRLPLPVPIPPPGRVSVEATGAPPAFWEAIGYPAAGPRALRVDMLDRLETELLTAAKEGRTVAEPALAQMIGAKPDELGAVMKGLGYTRSVAEDGAVSWRRRRNPRHKPRREAPVNADHPFAKLRQLSGIG